MLVKSPKEKKWQQAKRWIFYIEILLFKGFYSEDLKRYSSFLSSLPPFLSFLQINKSMVLEPVGFRFQSWVCCTLAVLFRVNYLKSLIISLFNVWTATLIETSKVFQAQSLA